MQTPPLPGHIGPIPLNWAYLPNHFAVLGAADVLDSLIFSFDAHKKDYSHTAPICAL